jgi:uncharacterized protein (UPF0335 family)
MSGVVGTDGVAQDMLIAGYQRWLRLEEAKADIGEDLKALFAELKGNGLAPKALRESFRRVRNIDDAAQKEHDAIVDLYVASLTGARPAHDARDFIEQFDAETGEILSTTPHPVDHETVGRHAREPRPDASSQPIQESPDATSPLTLEDSGGCTSSAGTEGDKTGTPIQPETATTSTEQPIAAAEVTTPDANTHGQTGTAHHGGLAASGPANAEAVAKKAKKVGQSEQEAAIELPVDTNLYAFTPKPLRPHCLRPLLCGGMGKDHCPSCQLAMAESKRATA